MSNHKKKLKTQLLLLLLLFSIVSDLCFVRLSD